MKRTPLKKVSKKRNKQNREYTELKKEFLLNHIDSYCPVMMEIFGKYVMPTEVHHKNHREGELLNKVEDWLAVSREGHDFIHAHPNTARNFGWLE